MSSSLEYTVLHFRPRSRPPELHGYHPADLLRRRILIGIICGEHIDAIFKHTIICL